jgi:hypothetical protein
MTEKCTCKYNPATLKSGEIYSVGSIGKKGTYYLEITDGKGVSIMSAEFTVE